jgi:hypothetical protein
MNDPHIGGTLETIMQLTRRDAVLALVSGGLLAGTQVSALTGSEPEQRPPRENVETLFAVSEVLYPTAVDPSREFVETYVVGRRKSASAYSRGLAVCLDALRQTSRRRTGKRFDELPRARREDVIRATGADVAFPDPDGDTAQQIRYYVINDLLYALYSTPKGGELVGNPNPMGHPGGTEAYQRGPTDE